MNHKKYFPFPKSLSCIQSLIHIHLQHNHEAFRSTEQRLQFFMINLQSREAKNYFIIVSFPTAMSPYDDVGFAFNNFDFNDQRKFFYAATKNKGCILGFQYKTLTPLLKVFFNVEQRSRTQRNYACIQMLSEIFIIYDKENSSHP